MDDPNNKKVAKDTMMKLTSETVNSDVAIIPRSPPSGEVDDHNETFSDEEQIIAEAALAEATGDDAPDDLDKKDNTEDTDSRPTLFLDDLYKCVDGVTSQIPQEKWALATIDWAYGQGLQLLFTKRGHNELKQMESWFTQMRPEIKHRLALAHRMYLPADALQSALPAPAAPAILDAAKKVREAHLASLQLVFADGGRNEQLKQWLGNNDLEMPASMHPTSQSLSSAAFKACVGQKKQVGRKLSASEVIEAALPQWTAAQYLSANINDNLEGIMVPLAEFLQEGYDKTLLPFFPSDIEVTDDVAMSFCTLRCKYIFKALRDSLTSTAIVQETPNDRLVRMEECISRIAASEIHKVATPAADDSLSLTKFWLDLFEAAGAAESLDSMLAAEEVTVKKRWQEKMKALEEASKDVVEAMKY